MSKRIYTEDDYLKVMALADKGPEPERDRGGDRHHHVGRGPHAPGPMGAVRSALDSLLGKSPLSDVLACHMDESYSLDDLTVLARGNDPFRQDTAEGHKNGGGSAARWRVWASRSARAARRSTTAACATCDAETRRLVERRIMVCLAGAETEAAWYRQQRDAPDDWEKRVRAGAQTDGGKRGRPRRLRTRGSLPELEAYLEWLHQRVLGWDQQASLRRCAGSQDADLAKARGILRDADQRWLIGEHPRMAGLSGGAQSTAEQLA